MTNDQNETEHSPQQSMYERKPLVLHEFLEGLRKDFSAGEVRNVACFLFQEELVLHTIGTMIGPPEGADLSAALDFLRNACGIACERIEGHNAITRIRTHAIAFRVRLPDTQAVLLHAMWQLEMQWRNSPPDTIPFNVQEIDLLRLVMRDYLAAFGLHLLTQQEALALLLPPGPYATYLGPVVVRWNNSSCQSICPFCSEDFKPAWRMWAFLYDPGGSPICLDCWHKGPLITPPADAETMPT